LKAEKKTKSLKNKNKKYLFFRGQKLIRKKEKKKSTGKIR